MINLGMVMLRKLVLDEAVRERYEMQGAML